MQPVKLKRNEIVEVETLIYLGSIIDKHGGTDADVQTRREDIRSSKVLSLYNNRLFNSNVKSLLLYGSKTWRITKTVQTFINTPDSLSKHHQ